VADTELARFFESIPVKVPPLTVMLLEAPVWTIVLPPMPEVPEASKVPPDTVSPH
jgi:hypothetical protein